MHPMFHRLSGAFLVFVLAALAGCGGGSGNGNDHGSGGAGGASAVVKATIGPAGGTLQTPGGASVVVPEGALAVDTLIGIEQTSAGSPARPSGLGAAGPMFAFTPHGIQFAKPVTVTLPFDPGAVPAGHAAALLKTDERNQWEPVTGAVAAGGTVSAQVSGFSFVQVVVPPVQRLEASQQWWFRVYPGNGLAPSVIDEDFAGGQLLAHIVEFGRTSFDAPIVGARETLPPDGRANGMVFSSADGVSFGTFVEAPSSLLGSATPIGSSSDFFQMQSFRKRADDASLTFTITRVFVDLRDFKPRSPTGKVFLRGMVNFQVYGHPELPGPPFFLAEATATVVGESGIWIPTAETNAGSQIPVWTRDVHFESPVTTILAGSCTGSRVELKLKRPITRRIDLSKVAKDELFTITSRITTSTMNRKGGGTEGDCQGTYAAAYLRDPQEISGTTLFFTGLEPVAPAPSGPPPLSGQLVEPLSCTPGPAPDPQAGLLQFDAASYTVDESADAPQSIAITRSGGSRGAVSATFRTGDGTAIAGADYTAVATTVFFADGETGRRLVTVPIVPNALVAPDKRLTLALSQPGGCAALGTQGTAELTIVDDDRSDLPPPAVGLDPGFGTGGKVSTPGFGGTNTAMAVQSDGKVVMAGGSITEFVLARYNADGSPDAGFGSGGRVSTDMVAGGIVQEEARAVAVQPDGRILVAGFVRPGLGFGFALARYLPDGSPDGSFGAGGKAVGTVDGRAFAMALQPDGKIVVAGDDPVLELVKVARFNAEGSVDRSFAGTGAVLTDVAGSGDLAGNVVLQPDGRILVSGEPIGGLPVGSTSVLRYLPDGSPDASFADGGKVTLAGQRVGEGMALQADGRIVLAGTLDTSTATMTGFAVTRLLPDGTPDGSFGTAGSVVTVVNGQGGDAARAVAVQPDGRIVVAGRSGRINPNFALARYSADGSPDANFATGGLTTIDFFGASDAAENVVILPGGKIVLGGVVRDQVDGYGMARLIP